MNNSANSLFLEQMGIKQLISLFDLLPDVLFWIKNNKNEFIHVNQAFIEHTGVRVLQDIIGKTDYDFSPVHIANQFSLDDNKILAGKIVTDRLEINIGQTGDTGWYSTSKKPITDENNHIIGSYGISRHLQKQAMALSNVDAIKVPVDYIRKHYQQPFTIDDLAEISHLSVSALERRFKKYLSKTPKKFIVEVRLENARRLLVESNISIAQVCEETGFTDHSYFSKQFKTFFGELPSDFRNNYR
jgi:AraC-like DNA-binding protein